MAAVRGSFCCARDMLFSQFGNLVRRQILPITRSFSRCTKNSQRAKFVVSRSSCGYLRRTYSTAAEPIPPPTPDGAPKEYPPKIKNIVDEISKLTLLEVTNLNELLKTTLKIQDAPMMQMSAMPAQAAEAKEEEAPKEEQTEFMVTLTKFDESAKVKLIKEIKNLLPEMNLVQAKKFVESTPQKIRDKVSKEEAEKIKKQVEAAGGSVEIE